jgi:hypothetical protein
MGVQIDQPSKIIEIVRDALRTLNDPDASLANAIRSAIRVARLRGDLIDLLWLELEMYDGQDERAFARVLGELSHYKPGNVIDQLRREAVEDYNSERTATVLRRSSGDDDKVYAGSVTVLDYTLAQLRQDAADLRSQLQTLSVRSHDDQLFNTQRHIARLTVIRERIRHRVYTYLSATEQKLVFSAINRDIFRRYQRYVDTRLAAIAPNILSELNRAYQQANGGDSAAYAQAAVSCRRVLKALADLVYPPRQDEVIGSDGLPRKLTEDKYLGRIIQFVWESSKESRSKQLIGVQAGNIWELVERLDDLANKGLHEQVTSEEVDLCVIQTYLFVGDVLRVHESLGQLPGPTSKGQP